MLVRRLNGKIHFNYYKRMTDLNILIYYGSTITALVYLELHNYIKKIYMNLGKKIHELM